MFVQMSLLLFVAIILRSEVGHEAREYVEALLPGSSLGGL